MRWRLLLQKPINLWIRPAVLKIHFLSKSHETPKVMLDHCWRAYDVTIHKSTSWLCCGCHDVVSHISCHFGPINGHFCALRCTQKQTFWIVIPSRVSRAISMRASRYLHMMGNALTLAQQLSHLIFSSGYLKQKMFTHQSYLFCHLTARKQVTFRLYRKSSYSRTVYKWSTGT